MAAMTIREYWEEELTRISHRPGYHSDFGEDVERKSHQAGWAV